MDHLIREMKSMRIANGWYKTSKQKKVENDSLGSWKEQQVKCENERSDQPFPLTKFRRAEIQWFVF